MLSKLRELIAVTLVGLALFLLGWAYWPVPIVQQDVLIRPEQVITPSGISPLSSAARVTIQWPRWVWVGESATVRVSVSAASTSAWEVFSSAAPSMSLAFKWDVLGARLSPPGTVSFPAQIPVHFAWTLQPHGHAAVTGLVWVSLQLNGEAVPLLAHSISMAVRAPGGFDRLALLWAGWGGLLTGLVLSFPTIERWILGKSA